MGIHYRNAAAVLVLSALCALNATAATRKNVDMPTRSSVVNGGGASFSTPNGEAAFYGQDYVDTHTAGNRFNVNDNPGGTGSRQKVTVKPVVTVDPKSVAKTAVQGIKAAAKANVGSAALGVAMSAVLGAVDAVMDTDNNTIRVPSVSEPSTDPTDFSWAYSGTGEKKFSTPKLACTDHVSDYSDKTRGMTVTLAGSTAYCEYERFDGFVWNETQDIIYRHGDKCSGTYIPSTGACMLPAGQREATPSDFDDMEKWAADQNSDFIRDLLKESCAGSSSPAACVEELSSWGDLVGPSTGTGPAVTSTTTTKNADGTTSQTSTTTQNHYNYSFGPTYYNYSTTTKKTTTNADGSVSETESSDGGLPADDETSQDEEYTYQDADFPEVEPFYEQKYPDGLAGVWNDIKAKIDNSAFMKFLQGFIPNFSGSCPTFSIPMNIAGFAAMGSYSLDSGIVCYSLDFAKVIILFTAVLTFRALVFGG